MRNPERIKEIIKELEQVWEKHPDLRLGQLILNVCDDIELYYIEDEDLIKVIKANYVTL